MFARALLVGGRGAIDGLELFRARANFAGIIDMHEARSEYFSQCASIAARVGGNPSSFLGQDCCLRYIRRCRYI